MKNYMQLQEMDQMMDIVLGVGKTEHHEQFLQFIVKRKKNEKYIFKYSFRQSWMTT